jgi:membrane protein YqaA with SNARE-associated domain
MEELDLLLSTLGAAIVSALVPLVNAELLALGAVAIAPPRLDFPLVLMVTLGQMLGKIVLFLVGRGSLRIPWMVKTEKIEEAGERLGRRGNLGAAMLLLSAVTGLPPFYLVSIACGLLRFSLPLFILIGSAGRLVRFSVVAFFPEVVAQIFPG